MTQAASTLPPPMVRLHACGECRARLLGLGRGVVVVPGPHVVDIDMRCETHGRTGALAASHVLDVPADLADELDAAREVQPLAPIDAISELHVLPDEAPLVAQLAVQLMCGQPQFESSDDAIAVFVRLARRVLIAAKGK